MTRDLVLVRLLKNKMKAQNFELNDKVKKNQFNKTIQNKKIKTELNKIKKSRLWIQ
jgi:hypothetical protein